SLILIILSIPTIFIQNSSINEIELVNPLNVWSIYMIFIGLCKLILVFFVFKLMLEIANENEDLNLIKRTTITFNIYIVVMLFNQIVQSFMMNMTRDILTALTLFMLISSFILEITFLVLLRKFRNMENRNNGNPLQNSSQIDTKV
ncbi:MAG TPA: hypothetical protein VEV44_02375, partial [Pseudoneobacillus sp.]|nr:hypothetical protein [Pseudoneobacillus sp.]